MAGVGERIDVGEGFGAGERREDFAAARVVGGDAPGVIRDAFRAGVRPGAAGQEVAGGAAGRGGDFVDRFVAHAGERPRAHFRDALEVAAAQEEIAAGLQEAGGQGQGGGEARVLERLGGVDDAVLAAALEQEQQRLGGQRAAALQEREGVGGGNGAVARGAERGKLLRHAFRRGIDLGRAFADAGVGEGHEAVPAAPGFRPALGPRAALDERVGGQAHEGQHDEPLEEDREFFHISDLLRVPQPVSANVSTAIGSCQTRTNM